MTYKRSCFLLGGWRDTEDLCEEEKVVGFDIPSLDFRQEVG